MTHGIAYLTMLASTSRFRALGSGVRGRGAKIDSSQVVTMVVVAAVVVIGIALLSRHAARRDRRRAFTNPRSLFRALCKAHGIDRRGRRLLRQMVRWYRLEQPAQLFVNPKRYELSQLSPELQKEGKAITALCEQLFRQPTSNDPSKGARGKTVRLQPTSPPDPAPVKSPIESPESRSPATDADLAVR